MTDTQIEKWNRQFEALGAKKVRGELMLGRFDKDKRMAARHWLEHNDARNWQAASPSGGSGRSFIINRRNAKWWSYAVAGAFLVVAIVMFARRF